MTQEPQAHELTPRRVGDTREGPLRIRRQGTFAVCDTDRMPDLAAFLTARLDEDQAAARLVTEGTRGWTVNDWVAEDGDVVFAGSDFEHDITEGRFVAHVFPLEPAAPIAASIAAYIARNDPVRVLAEVAAKRAILAFHTPITSDVSPVGELLCEAETVGDNHYHSTPWPCPTLRILATIYADHPDYDDSWRLNA